MQSTRASTTPISTESLPNLQDTASFMLEDLERRNSAIKKVIDDITKKAPEDSALADILKSLSQVNESTVLCLHSINQRLTAIEGSRSGPEYHSHVVK